MKSLGRYTVTRSICGACGFLQTQCVCQWIPKLTTPLRVIIIQDPKEAKHAKNTVTLLRLVLSVECVLAQEEQVAAKLAELRLENWRLVFPHEHSSPIEQATDQDKAVIEGVILIDATWRKAKRLFLSMPALQTLTSWHFLSPPDEVYAIRKSPSKHAVSTLEACAYAIEQVTQQNMQALRDFMLVSQSHQWRQQPSEHKHS